MCNCKIFNGITEEILFSDYDLDLDNPADDAVPNVIVEMGDLSEDSNEILEDIADLCVKLRDSEDPQVKDDYAARIIEMIEVELGN